MQMLTNNLDLNIENYLIDNFNKLKINSKEIKKGDVFTALQGKNNHGNIFIEQALIKGVKYVINQLTGQVYNLASFYQGNPVQVGTLIIEGKGKNQQYIYEPI